MTEDLFHPEALLDRELDTQLTRADEERLHEHLRECSACRLERALRQSVALPLSREEELLAQRAADRTAQRFLQPVPRQKLVSASALRWGMLVASIGLVAVGFAAIGRSLTLRTRTRMPAPAAARLSGSDKSSVAPVSTPPTGSVAEAGAETAVIPAAPSLAPAPTPPASVERVESPAELFARANHARRQDQSETAASLYRDLQARFPKSNEALVSCVTLGRLMLDRLNQPTGALAQFQRYLRAVPGGGLREEAIIGRALALGRLGRGPEEQTAWQVLLKEYPDSMYSERARARLAP
jgi:TolA-binding protein